MHALASSVDIFADIWNAAQTAGPFANMFLIIVVIVLNKERKELIRKNDALNERLITMATNAVSAVTNVNSLLNRAAGKE